MTTAETELIQATFRSLAADADRVAERFYENLFAAAPRLRRLFKTPPEVQRRKFMYTLEMLVRAAARPDQLLPEAAELGRRHAGYGIEPEHYRYVREALVLTLRECLGAHFTAAAEAAWRELYDIISDTMQGRNVRPVASELSRPLSA